MVKRNSKITKAIKKDAIDVSIPVLTEANEPGCDGCGYSDPQQKNDDVKLEENKESVPRLNKISVKTRGRNKVKTKDLQPDKNTSENQREKSDMSNDEKLHINSTDYGHSLENVEELKPNDDHTAELSSSDGSRIKKRNKKSGIVEKQITTTTVPTRARVRQKKLDHLDGASCPDSSEQKDIGFRKKELGESEIAKDVVKPGKRKREPSSAVAHKKTKEHSVNVDINTTPQLPGANQKVAPGRRKFVGAHTSIAGGLSNAIRETLAIGGHAFALFLKSQRTWNSKPLEDADAEHFKISLKESGISPNMVVPHGSYLLNCGSPDDAVLKKSRTALIDEMTRCDKLELPIYNFHPGSSKGEISVEECIKRIADSINLAHSQTSNVIAVIENMCGQGYTIGGKFSELKAIIDGVKDKSRVGVCLDTCHAFAAGYDLKSVDGYENMKKEFIDVIGHHYLKAVHLNDSKGEVGCHLDRHENIGKGKLGLATFKRMMNDPFFDNIPMILETPEGDYGKEISELYSFCDK